MPRMLGEGSAAIDRRSEAAWAVGQSFIASEHVAAAWIQAIRKMISGKPTSDEDSFYQKITLMPWSHLCVKPPRMSHLYVANS